MNNDVSTLIMSLVMAVSIVGIIVYMIMAASLWKIFKDNGEKGYKAIIPLYNIYVLMKIVTMPGWMLLLYFIPIVNLFALAFLSVRVANTFEKGAGFAIGLLFFPFIFYPLLAFSHKGEEPLEEVTKIEEKEEGKVCPICGTTLAKDATTCFVCGESVVPKEETPIVMPEEKRENTPVLESEPILDSPKEEIPSVSYDFMDEEKEDVPFTFPSEDTFKVEEEEKPEMGEPISFEEEKFNEEKMPEIIEEKKEEIPSMKDILKVDSHYEEKKETPKYKSSTKTLDEILRINSDLYAAQEADRKERERKKNLELRKEKAEQLEKQADELLKMIEEVEKEGDKEAPIETEKSIEINHTPNPEPVSIPKIEEPLLDSSIAPIPYIEPQKPSMEPTPYIEPATPKVSAEEPNLLKELDVNQIEEEMNQVKQEKVEEPTGRLRTCPSCGSTIPRYSHRCLLCGTQID